MDLIRVLGAVGLCYNTDFVYKNGLEFYVNRIVVFSNELRILYKSENHF